MAAPHRLLLVSRDVQFVIDAKRTLEALGDFTVSPVADPRNALNLLQEPRDLVLLDTADLPLAPALMIELMRERQADIRIVLAPDSPDVRALAERCAAQAVVNAPAQVRSLLPVLRRVLSNRPQSASAPAPEAGYSSSDTQEIESLLSEPDYAPAPSYTTWRVQASLQLLQPPEPEKPGFEIQIEPGESDRDLDTVRFFSLGDGEALDSSPVIAPSEDGTNEAVRTLRDWSRTMPGLAVNAGETTEMPMSPSSPKPASGIHADSDISQLLDALLDESTDLNALRLQAPLKLSLGASRHGLHGGPRSTDRARQMPQFTAVSSAAKAAAAAAVMPPATPPREVVPDFVPASPAAGSADLNPARASAPAENAPATAAQPLTSREQDPLAAQLALTITRLMGDSTADASLLTRESRIVAFAGDMGLQELRALRAAIADDWAAGADQSRIRSIQLPESGADYVICSRATVAGLTLTLIFGGDRHLRDIRRQGERMLQALQQAAPQAHTPLEHAPAVAEPGARDTGQRSITLAWLLANPSLRLRKPLAQQLVFWLEVQLQALDWDLQRLDVYEEFVILQANVPRGATPAALAQLAMERARDIARAEDQRLPDNLWADANLVLQPGREVSETELQAFLQFARS